MTKRQLPRRRVVKRAPHAVQYSATYSTRLMNALGDDAFSLTEDLFDAHMSMLGRKAYGITFHGGTIDGNELSIIAESTPHGVTMVLDEELTQKQRRLIQRKFMTRPQPASFSNLATRGQARIYSPRSKKRKT